MGTSEFELMKAALDNFRARGLVRDPGQIYAEIEREASCGN